MAEFLKNRKRNREEVLPCESAPLSKRMNSLHLNNSSCSIPPLGSGDSNNYLGLTSGPGAGGGGSAVVTYPPIDEYNPELGAEENPYYYEENKMLYHLHVERMKRNNQ